MKVIADPDRTKIYMVMEWFDGKTLREILKKSRSLLRSAPCVLP